MTSFNTLTFFAVNNFQYHLCGIEINFHLIYIQIVIIIEENIYVYVIILHSSLISKVFTSLDTILFSYCIHELKCNCSSFLQWIKLNKNLLTTVIFPVGFSTV